MGLIKMRIISIMLTMLLMLSSGAISYADTAYTLDDLRSGASAKSSGVVALRKASSDLRATYIEYRTKIVPAIEKLRSSVDTYISLTTATAVLEAAHKLTDKDEFPEKYALEEADILKNKAILAAYSTALGPVSKYLDDKYYYEKLVKPIEVDYVAIQDSMADMSYRLSLQRSSAALVVDKLFITAMSMSGQLEIKEKANLLTTKSRKTQETLQRLGYATKSDVASARLQESIGLKEKEKLKRSYDAVIRQLKLASGMSSRLAATIDFSKGLIAYTPPSRETALTSALMSRLEVILNNRETARVQRERAIAYSYIGSVDDPMIQELDSKLDDLAYEKLKIAANIEMEIDEAYERFDGLVESLERYGKTRISQEKALSTLKIKKANGRATQTEITAQELKISTTQMTIMSTEREIALLKLQIVGAIGAGPSMEGGSGQ
jgi:hypothetical protein